MNILKTEVIYNCKTENSFNKFLEQVRIEGINTVMMYDFSKYKEGSCFYITKNHKLIYDCLAEFKKSPTFNKYIEFKIHQIEPNKIYHFTDKESFELFKIELLNYSYLSNNLKNTKKLQGYTYSPNNSIYYITTLDTVYIINSMNFPDAFNETIECNSDPCSVKTIINSKSITTKAFDKIKIKNGRHCYDSKQQIDLFFDKYKTILSNNLKNLCILEAFPRDDAEGIVLFVSTDQIFIEQFTYLVLVDNQVYILNKNAFDKIVN